VTIRVLLADDQALLRETFRILIDSCPDMEVVGEAADGAEAVTLTRARHPLTVRTHIQRAMMKLHARDRAQLVVIAYQSGLVHPMCPRHGTT
jgi:DNA-binding NarL/FixJ family response regulator